MKNKKGTCLIFIGILFIAAALGITVYNILDEKRADAEVLTAAEQVRQEINSVSVPEEYADEPVVPDYVLNPDADMPKVEIDGKEYIGILEIPSLGLTLPVLRQWSYAGLKKAPCCYAGSAYESGFVIAAHNYDGHFGRLKNLSEGDSIRFTDADGNVFEYYAASFESLGADAVEDMLTDEWDMTLFTCTTGGQSRFTVRCEREGIE